MLDATHRFVQPLTVFKVISTDPFHALYKSLLANPKKDVVYATKSTTILVCVSPSVRGRDGLHNDELYDRYTTEGTTNSNHGSRLHTTFRQ